MSQPPIRIHLSPPHLGAGDRELVLDAIDSNWIAPLGPHVDAFEREFAQFVGVRHAVALSSGTAALHLALQLVGVGPGDLVLCPTMTFVASANAISYTGARPVFVDADPQTWNVDVDLLRRELEQAGARGVRYAAILAVDLYGRCCDYDVLEPLCAEYRMPLVEDAAEALGAECDGRRAGTFGAVGAFSFNGNKIITTSGGGMLVTDDAGAARRARFLAAQARDDAPHYQHSEMGFNYRMSNILAALGRGQLRHLPDRVRSRHAIHRRYRDRLRGLPGITVHDSSEQGNAWLTCIRVDPLEAGVTPGDLRTHLRAHGIEARPVWKPLHLQPLFASDRVIGGRVSEDIFSGGLCLPSGSSLSAAEQDEICQHITDVVVGAAVGRPVAHAEGVHAIGARPGHLT